MDDTMVVGDKVEYVSDTGGFAQGTIAKVEDNGALVDINGGAPGAQEWVPFAELAKITDFELQPEAAPRDLEMEKALEGPQMKTEQPIEPRPSNLNVGAASEDDEDPSELDDLTGKKVLDIGASGWVWYEIDESDPDWNTMNLAGQYDGNHQYYSLRTTRSGKPYVIAEAENGQLAQARSRRGEESLGNWTEYSQELQALIDAGIVREPYRRDPNFDATIASENPFVAANDAKKMVVEAMGFSDLNGQLRACCLLGIAQDKMWKSAAQQVKKKLEKEMKERVKELSKWGTVEPSEAAVKDVIEKVLMEAGITAYPNLVRAIYANPFQERGFSSNGDYPQTMSEPR